ncbi:glycosyltransferase [Tropicimonas sp. IMCC6043]|uniref:glycosyltransferase family 2 protein n=1 Tax=Tropicimonas sp. IMCC6043 TaxID=2510645 RepID=UPI00101BA39C|nr:glycosyltransferase [Tropicimonas sp. IMCC6043]RYH11629.1 glycosyltransferase [Tropicimonas sp. IMCC6043]
MSEIQSVSVIVPSRNNAESIAETLRSFLDDTVVREAIVVDHRSTDGTVQVARDLGDPRVRVIEDDGRGISRAMNIGLAASTAPYVAKIDADDLVPRGRFAWQADFLDRTSDVMAVCGAFEAIDDAGRQLETFAATDAARDVTEEYLQQKRPTHFGAWLCRREGWEAVGGFREWFVTAEDIDMPFRLAHAGRISFEPRLSYSYRIRTGSITRTQSNTLREFYENSAIEFARQRLATGSDDLDRGTPPALPSSQSKNHTLAGSQAAGFLTGRAWREHHKGQRIRALRTMAQSVAAAPPRQRFRQIRGFLVMLAKSAVPPREM